jgi:putative transposase
VRYMEGMAGRAKGRGRKRWQQLELRARTWGGKRKGAGRKRRGRRMVSHRPRKAFRRRAVLHVTVRVVEAVGRLRRRRLVPVLRAALVAGALKDGFRICQFSIQGNHVHLVCEAQSSVALSRGMQGFKIRLARRINRALARRGAVFADRYHAVSLATPRQVRAALCYVLNNGRRHGERLDSRWGGIDPFSSAWYFDGWSSEAWRSEVSPPVGLAPVAPAESWLLRIGWRRCGLIHVKEVPGGASP